MEMHIGQSCAVHACLRFAEQPEHVQRPGFDALRKGRSLELCHNIAVSPVHVIMVMCVIVIMVVMVMIMMMG
jgi:hypothetical protein